MAASSNLILRFRKKFSKEKSPELLLLLYSKILIHLLGIFIVAFYKAVLLPSNEKYQKAGNSLPSLKVVLSSL